MLLACALWLHLPSVALAQDGAGRAAAVASEARLQAAYLLKFRNYVEWLNPAAAPGEETVIAVADADDVAEELVKMLSQQAVGARYGMRRLRAGEGLDGVHILYLGGNDWARYRALIAQAQARSILVVTGAEQGLVHGSVVNFRFVDDRVRFEISMPAADSAGLKLGALLLKLALNVSRAK